QYKTEHVPLNLCYIRNSFTQNIKDKSLRQSAISQINESNGFRHLAELNQKMEEDNSATLEKATAFKPHSMIFENIYPTVLAQRDKKPNDDSDVAMFGKVIQAAVDLEDISFEENSSNKKIVTVIDGIFLIERSIEEFKKYTLWLTSIIDMTQGVDLLAFQELLVKSKYIDDLTIVIGELKRRPLLEKPNVINLKNFQTRFKSRFLEENSWLKKFYEDEVLLIITFLRQINSPLDYEYFSHQFLDIILNFLKIAVEIDMEYEKFLADNYQNTDEFNRYKNASNAKTFSESHAHHMSMNLLTEQYEAKIKEIKADYDKKSKNQKKQAKRQKNQAQSSKANLLNQKQYNDLEKEKQLTEQLKDAQNQLKEVTNERNQQQKTLESFQKSQRKWQAQEKHLKKTLEEKSCWIHDAKEKIDILKNEKNLATKKADLSYQEYQRLLTDYHISQNSNQELQTENQNLKQELAQLKLQSTIKVSSESLSEETSMQNYGYDNTILRFKLAQARDKLEEIKQENQVYSKTLGHVYNRYVPSPSYKHPQTPFLNPYQNFDHQ
ncbi:MAG: hypothetical protein ACRYGR_02305, partial [Janthinobacterium lividum]